MNRINRVNSKRYGFTILDNFQFGPLLWVLNLIGNNAFRRGVQMNPLLNPLMVQSLRLYHFYCPNESLWTSWEGDFRTLGGGRNSV